MYEGELAATASLQRGEGLESLWGSIGQESPPLVSRNGHSFASFSDLASSMARSVEKASAILDGEIVCLDSKGRPHFKDLLFHRGQPRFFAFDLLHLDGKDLRYEQLTDRKASLRELVNRAASAFGTALC